MTRVRVENFTISLDGFGAGPDQSVDNPEALFRDLDLPALGYQCADHAGSEAATHVILKRKGKRDA